MPELTIFNLKNVVDIDPNIWCMMQLQWKVLAHSITTISKLPHCVLPPLLLHASNAACLNEPLTSTGQPKDPRTVKRDDEGARDREVGTGWSRAEKRGSRDRKGWPQIAERWPPRRQAWSGGPGSRLHLGEVGVEDADEWPPCREAEARVSAEGGRFREARFGGQNVWRHQWQARFGGQVGTGINIIKLFLP